MNVFKSMAVSTSFLDLPIHSILSAIKLGYVAYNGKMLTTGAVWASKEDKHSEVIYRGGKNKYNNLKMNNVFTWCPNALFNNGHRHLKELKGLTGLVYYDVDGVDAEATKELVSKLPFVYAAWKSLSGTGIGFLVKSDFTAEDFRQSYYALYAYFKVEHKLEVDRVSDYSRCNVFSYDENIYINEEATKVEAETIAQMLITYKDAIPKLKKSTPARNTNVQGQTRTNFSDLFESLGGDLDYETKITIAINHAINSKGEYKVGNKHNFRTSFLGTCATMSIPYDVVLEQFEIYAQSINQTIDYDATEFMFREFEGQGNSSLDELIKTSPLSNIVVSKSIKVRKYIDNQIDTNFTENTLLIAPTGTGKSTFVMEKMTGKRIVICPNTSILRNFKIFEEVSVFYGDEKSPIFKDVILTTQDSFANLVKKLEDKGDNLLDYTVIIDEFHTLVTSAHYGYKYKAINEVIEVLKTYPVVVVGLTATPITSATNTFFEDYAVIEIKQFTDVKRLIKLTEYDDYNSFVLEKCLENYKDKTVTVVYKNDKRNIDVLAAALVMQGLKVVVVNADTKEAEDYKKLVEEGNLDVDVVLTTSLLREGVSLKAGGDKTKVDYIVTGDCHYTEINQLSSRVRNATAISITLASSKNSYKNYKLPFFFDDVVNSIDSANEFLLRRLNTTKQTDVETKLDQKLLGSAIKLNKTTGVYEVDYVYKDYLIYAEEVKVCSINPMYTIARLLEDERFDVHTRKIVYKEDNKECISAAEELVYQDKAEKSSNFVEVVAACKEGKTDIEKLEYIRENGTDSREKVMAYYTGYVLSRMVNPSLPKAIAKAYDFANCDSNRKFNEFRTQLELGELFTNYRTVNGISAQLFKEVKSRIKLNKQYTSEQIHDIFLKSIAKTDAKDYLKMTKTKATQWFNLMGLSFTKSSKDKNRKTVRTYRLETFGLADYNYSTKTVSFKKPVLSEKAALQEKAMLGRYLEELLMKK